jgi:hypothetical protein
LGGTGHVVGARLVHSDGGSRGASSHAHDGLTEAPSTRQCKEVRREERREQLERHPDVCVADNTQAHHHDEQTIKIVGNASHGTIEDVGHEAPRLGVVV